MEYSVVRLYNSANPEERPRTVIIGSDLIDSVRASVGNVEPIATLSGKSLFLLFLTIIFRLGFKN